MSEDFDGSVEPIKRRVLLLLQVVLLLAITGVVLALTSVAVTAMNFLTVFAGLHALLDAVE